MLLLVLGASCTDFYIAIGDFLLNADGAIRRVGQRHPGGRKIFAYNFGKLLRNTNKYNPDGDFKNK